MTEAITVFAVLYLILNGITGLSYLCIPIVKIRLVSVLSNSGLPIIWMAAFVLACGFHHIAHLTMWFDMRGHMSLMYSNAPWGYVRFAFDLIMCAISGMTAKIMIKEMFMVKTDD